MNKDLIKKVRKFQPWDYGLNLDLEQEMLRDMYTFWTSDKPIVVGAERVAREINLAINLLDIILENDNSYDFLADKPLKYVNIRNSLRFITFNSLGDNDFVFKEIVRQEKAWYLYNKLRYYRMRTWWD